jgi:hypothetical protein
MMGAARPGRTLAALLSGLLLVGVGLACGQGGSQAGTSYPTINGIPCDLGERLAFHIHTHTDDEILHIESPVQRAFFTLGDFFAIWGQPLSSNQVASATGPVIAYVNGDPSQITLQAHELVQLDVGDETPPQPFTFAPGL